MHSLIALFNHLFSQDLHCIELLSRLVSDEHDLPERASA